jgi:hypothetical protein
MSMAGLFGGDLSDAGDGSLEIEGKAPPSEKILNWLHGRASTTRPEDVHHRIGTGVGEVSPGRHQHDGKDSLPLFDEFTLIDVTGASTTAELASAINAINAALRARGAL